MTPEQFARLKKGDVVRNEKTGEASSVTAATKDFPRWDDGRVRRRIDGKMPAKVTTIVELGNGYLIDADDDLDEWRVLFDIPEPTYQFNFTELQARVLFAVVSELTTAMRTDDSAFTQEESEALLQVQAHLRQFIEFADPQ